MALGAALRDLAIVQRRAEIDAAAARRLAARDAEDHAAAAAAAERARLSALGRIRAGMERLARARAAWRCWLTAAAAAAAARAGGAQILPEDRGHCAAALLRLRCHALLRRCTCALPPRRSLP